MNKRYHAFGDTVNFIIRDGFENLNTTANTDVLQYKKIMSKHVSAASTGMDVRNGHEIISRFSRSASAPHWTFFNQKILTL